MRPLVLGRKNWLHIGSPEAGPKVAAIASIVETCRRLSIHLRAYLADVLPRFGRLAQPSRAGVNTRRLESRAKKS
jgi:hypothetical protein